MARAKQPEAAAAEDTFTPPFYEATETIYFHHPNGETMPTRAYNKGDQVPADIVESHKLGGQVRVPDVFAGQLPDPHEHVAQPAEPPVVDGSIQPGAEPDLSTDGKE